MAKFSSPAKQAISVIKTLQGTVIKSIGTARNYQACLTRVAEYMKVEQSGSLRSLTVDQAQVYLDKRSEIVSQSQLNMERQAIQKMMKHVTDKLSGEGKLQVIKSQIELAKKSRFYTRSQVEIIMNGQKEQNALTTAIAYACGLRAHEPYTLRKVEERAAHIRPSLQSKFLGREGVKYTVAGKGGLIREILLPSTLSEKLEKLRLATPTRIKDRGVTYIQHYNINAGNRWSSSFSAASNRILKRSSGGHGLRHSYAQERMKELKYKGLSRAKALQTVSQEMGHFRPEITLVYLR